MDLCCCCAIFLNALSILKSSFCFSIQPYRRFARRVFVWYRRRVLVLICPLVIIVETRVRLSRGIFAK